MLGGAPYGYRYVTKQEGAGEAHFEVVWEEARVVRQVFEWVGRDRCSIGEVRRRLEAPRNEHGLAKPSGTGPPLAACSTIQRTRARQPLAKR